jgi:hypothetical protein
MHRAPKPVICREIVRSDFDRLADLMTSGYPSSSHDFWLQRLGRLSQHASPLGYPKYGFVLERDGAPIGGIFTVFSSVIVNELSRIRCYLTNWYVTPEYRSYASMLAKQAKKYKEATYFIGTPSGHARPILEAQGYTRYCDGRFTAAPALSRRHEDARVAVLSDQSCGKSGLPPPEEELLLRHARYGCISLTCSSASGVYPFVFHPRLKARVVPFARLVYCRDLSDLVRLAAPLGRFLISRGYPLIVLDANGPVPGLVGAYSGNFPKFFSGPDQPRLGDSAYSARVIFDS